MLQLQFTSVKSSVVSGPIVKIPFYGRNLRSGKLLITLATA
jgi:hypothetical protein